MQALMMSSAERKHEIIEKDESCESNKKKSRRQSFAIRALDN